MSKYRTKKRIMRKFVINEISGVDRPAQRGARMTIMKRDEDHLEKRAQMTSSVNGHAHLIYDDDNDGGDTSWVSGEGDSNGHSHPWIKRDDGSIEIGDADGHSHTLVDVTFKRVQSERIDKVGSAHKGITQLKPTDKIGNTKESLMTEKVEKAIEDLTIANASLQKDLAKAQALCEFSDADKEYYNTLNDTQKSEFITKSAEDRMEVVKAAKAEDPVVYKSLDGTEFRKSDDTRLIDLSKRADDAEKLAKAERELRENSDLAKRASVELSHLPGEESVKVTLLKAIDNIEDEAQRTEALKLVKANNEAMSKAFETKGTSGSPAGNSATEKLNNLAKKYGEDHKVGFNKAYTAVLDTPEGKTLYDQTIN